MAKNKLKQIIAFLAGIMQKSEVRVSKIIVFGSQVRGGADEGSDVDLIIISRDFKGKNIIERGRMTMNAELSAIHKFKIPFDILTMTPEEYKNGGIISGIAKQEGKVFYSSH